MRVDILQHKKSILFLAIAFLIFCLVAYLFVEITMATESMTKMEVELTEMRSDWNEFRYNVLEVCSTSPDDSLCFDLRDRFVEKLNTFMQGSSFSQVRKVYPPIDQSLDRVSDIGRTLAQTNGIDDLRGFIWQDRPRQELSFIRNWIEMNAEDQRRTYIILAIFFLLSVVCIALALFSLYADLRFSQQRALRTTRGALKVIEVQEEERQRISLELHDGVAQLLASAAMALRDEGRISQARELVVASENEIRRLSRGLGIPDLDRMGFEKAVAYLVSSIAEPAGIIADCSVIGLDDVGLSMGQKIHIYRIIQECLLNTRKHARAGKLSVKIVASYPSLIVRYADDGVGFDEGTTEDDGIHLGLRGMRERAMLLNGTLTLSSVRGKGTKIVLMVPLEREV